MELRRASRSTALVPAALVDEGDVLRPEILRGETDGVALAEAEAFAEPLS